VPKAPALRSDLKVSRQVMSERVSFVIKDTLKTQYFRFDEEEWKVISLFDGTRTLEEMVVAYNSTESKLQIDHSTLKDYQQKLEEMKLLESSKRDQNIMLIEKMKEMRKSRLLSQKGTLLYRRFPVIDPDKFFNKIIPHIGFFWTKKFFVLAIGSMILAASLIFYDWNGFEQGVRQVFSFSEMSAFNWLLLWITIFAIIGVHELGHGLTCKYYGGEVHEIGVLLLFFQPCLYCNVNDAWLFDQKWKQIMVTVAGSFIELAVGTIFVYIWFISPPQTLLNTLSLQVVSVCTAATVLFNFNPLVKLDGYYLLADFLEIPNLRDSSFSYVKYFVSRYIFFQKPEEIPGTRREKIIFFTYGVLSLMWVTSLTLGLFFLAKTFLTENYFGFGVVVSMWVAYKLFGSHMKKAGVFLIQFLLSHKVFFQSPKGRKIAAFGLLFFLSLFLIPVSYTVNGHCLLEPTFTQVIRAGSDGFLRKLLVDDGYVVKPGQVVAELENTSLHYDRVIQSLAVDKMSIRVKQAMRDDLTHKSGLESEMVAKQAEFKELDRQVNALKLTFEGVKEEGVISCNDIIRKLNTFIKAGDELCRVNGVAQLKAVIEIPEDQVRFVAENDTVEFKVLSSPFKTYVGQVARIRTLSRPDTINPKAKQYSAEILFRNPGDLRPGMTGVAEVGTKSVSVARYVVRKFMLFFRLDLFY